MDYYFEDMIGKQMTLPPTYNPEKLQNSTSSFQWTFILLFKLI